MSIANEIPAEIWSRIVSYMPKGERGRLYAVNRALFYIMMDIYYETIHIGITPGTGDSRALDILRGPLISRSVQTIVVDLQPLGCYLDYSRSLFRRNVTEGLPCRPISIVEGLIQPFSAPVDFHSHLPNLQNLRVEYNATRNSTQHHYHFNQLFRTYIQNAMQSISNNLRSLTLNIPLESYRDGALNSSQSFSRLEHLDLQIVALYSTTDHEGVLELSIVPLINRHASSLTSLSIFFAPYLSWYRLQFFYRSQRLFQALTHIPQLSVFRVQLYMTGPQQTDLSGLCGFLEKHFETLTSLDLLLFNSLHRQYHIYALDPHENVLHHLFKPDTLFSQQLFTRAIPSCQRLQHLNLQCLFKESFQPSPQPFIDWFRSSINLAETLTTLALPHNVLEQSDLLSLLIKVDFPSLRSIQFKLFSMNTMLFDLLASKLPFLRTLEIDASSIFPRPDREYPNGLEEQFLGSLFLQDLRSCYFPQWTSLTELDVSLHPAGAPGLTELLLAAFPHVLKCNGIYREVDNSSGPSAIYLGPRD